jgi:hypothetical protein
VPRLQAVAACHPQATRDDTILTQVACPPLPGNRRLLDFFRIVKERSRSTHKSRVERSALRTFPQRSTLDSAPQAIGGGERDRTDDPLLAKQVLSQLSYAPELVGLVGLEPTTPRLSSVCSNQLSYRPCCQDLRIASPILPLSRSR